MNKAPMDEATLNTWIGKTQSSTDTLHAAQARLMEATIDFAPSLTDGDELPPLWHWLYFLSGAPMTQLGSDGHAALGEFLPPVPLPRRMWAGGRLSFQKPILLGETITKRSTIKNIVSKQGSSGALCFVTVCMEYFGDDNDLRISDEQDLVYRENPDPGAPPPKSIAPPTNPMESFTISPSTVQLFRYSALTFNSHRIHYDRDYCQNVEAYPGLIFHGPLAATLLADCVSKHLNGKKLKNFNFRAVAPLYDTAPFTISHDGNSTYWAQTPDGDLAMKADIEFQ